MRLLDDRILVSILENEEKSPSGLYIPESAQDQPVTALITAVGNGSLSLTGERIPLDVVQGDIVLINRHAGQIIKRNGTELRLMTAREILVVLDVEE